MKRIIWGMVLSAMPPLVHSTLGVDEDTHQNVDAHRVVIVADGADQDATGTTTAAADGGDATGHAFVPADAGAVTDGRSEGGRNVVHLHRMSVGEDKTGGWLGVSIGTVPDALVAQLKLDGRGLLIENVVTDSPADQAGLQRYDIVLSIDGQDVGSDIRAATESISAHAPGETAHLMVLRNGANMPIDVTLGSRAELTDQDVEWKYDVGPSAVVEDQLRTRGKFMFKDGDGNWVTKDLGDLDQLDNLPADIRANLPKSGTRTITVERLDGDNTVRLTVKRDGSSININQDNGGPIVVERTDARGVESTATYQTPEELKAADAEAFDLYDNAGGAQTFTLKLDGFDDLRGMFDLDQDFDWAGDGVDWRKHVAEWQAQLEESLGAIREAYEESMAQAERMVKELHDKAWIDRGDGHHAAPSGSGDAHPFLFHPFGSMAKPKHTFETRADGTIEVRIRKGDAELVQRYASEQDLQQRAPGLYEKYDDLMSLDTD